MTIQDMQGERTRLVWQYPLADLAKYITCSDSYQWLADRDLTKHQAFLAPMVLGTGQTLDVTVDGRAIRIDPNVTGLSEYWLYVVIEERANRRK